ncbi:hypothetical protein DdX_20602 [Ditylenchus destructor]|uniref:Uncharacterized protein n=1 Tax=Ditylenchus destructor TaxID=166010 RepID=A0AAD4MHT0_9BILA|nr:hypothetical protein DdX_20602 [Ditylenchus destructor]
MASQKKRRKDYLESNGVPVIFVSSVKGQAKAVTVLDDSTQCYTWSKSGRIDRRKDKTEIQTFVCTTCRALNAKANQGLVTKTNFDLPTKKLIKFEDGHAVTKNFMMLNGVTEEASKGLPGIERCSGYFRIVSERASKSCNGAGRLNSMLHLVQNGRIDRRKDKTEIQTFVCTTCRALNAKANQGLVTKTNFDLPTKKLIKFEDGHAEWVSKEYHDEHVRGCVTQDSDKVLAEGLVQDQINTISTGLLKCTASVAVKGVEIKLTPQYGSTYLRGCKEIPVHLKEEYRRNAAEIEEAKRQLQDDDLEGIFDASHNSSMESVNTAKLGQYLVVVGAHMGNSVDFNPG